MSYVPSYTSRINWENEPSTTSPINETNLNKMDYALYQHDQALQGQDGRISTLEGASKVTSFKGRTGAVVPADDDYTIAQIKATGTAGQVPTLNSQGKLEMADVPESGHEIVNPSGTSMTQRSKLKFMGSVSVSDDSANNQTVINVTGGGGGGSGHTIQNPSGSSMTQRTNLQFTGTGVTVTDNGTDDKTVVNISSAGHKILKADGTELPQRDALQASDGLEFVDDFTNQRTKVKMNLPIVSFEDWNAMTEQEQEAYKASHYRFGVEQPDASGVINAEYMKLLWENPNTTQAFASQTITLNSADYDFLLWIFTSVSSINLQISVISEKGKDVVMQYAAVSSSACAAIRSATRSSDTQYAITDCFWSLNGGARTTDNTRCIPIAVYGIKKNFQFKVNAIANELSTRADHCFLDDETTTVEDKFDSIDDRMNATKIDTANSHTFTGTNQSHTCQKDGYLYVMNNYNVYGVAIIADSDGNQLCALKPVSAVSGQSAYTSCYVKKGMIVKTATTAPSSCEFRAIK